MISNEKINVLIVDDLPEKLLVLETILAVPGQNIVSARSGEEALRCVLDNEFAVILLDVNMPGMDGLETAAFIRRRKKSAHTPIIFVTAFADEMHAIQGYSLGAVDYILSPIIPEVLRTKVKVFVELFRMTQQAKLQAEERVALVQEQAARAMAEEAARRSRFLAEASRILANSLDLMPTVEGVIRLVVPFLGDYGAILLVDDRGRLTHNVIALPDAANNLHVRTIAGLETVETPLGEALENVMASVNSKYLPAIRQGPEAGRFWDALTLKISAEEATPVLDSGSEVVISLLARGRTLGILALAQGPRRREYSPSDLAILEDLATRAAIAIDNARLYQSIQEADKRKNEFLSMLAHELRNPLAPIRNAVHILSSTDTDDGKVKWSTEVIDRQANQLIRLVDDLLDVSRITQGKIHLKTETTDIAMAVARAVETSRPLIDSRKHRLTVNMPPEPILTMADPVRVAQAVSNLLNNAAKFTDEGGQIWLTVEHNKNEAVVRVRDTGVGIPLDMQASIFDLFTQSERSLDRSQGGLGIGLTLTRRLIEIHGGSVEVFSEGPNQGSEFVIRLPILLPNKLEKLPGKEFIGFGSRGKSIRVLIVDDNRDAADSLKLLLGPAGHEVQACYDGAQALEMAREFHPQLIFLDIGLPTIDGYEVARRLRKETAFDSTLIVALTGYGQEEDVRIAMAAGFDRHLVKPADLSTLSALFASLHIGSKGIPQAPLAKASFH